MTDRATFEAEVESAHVLGSNFWGRALVRDASGKRITVMGSMLGLEAGDAVRVRGVWTNHPKYGEQVKAFEIEAIRATTPDGAIAWLSKRLPRVGKVRAELMIEAWGVEGTWKVLDDEPERLVEIKGIRAHEVLAISAEYRAHRGERDRMVALRDMGLTDNQAAAATAAYSKESVVEKVRSNPYDLIRVARGIGFKRADLIARKIGVRPTDPSRIAAGISHVLAEAANAGHTYVRAGHLRNVAAALLEVTQDTVLARMRELRAAGSIPGNPGRAQLPRLRNAERSIAGYVQRLANGKALAA